ncbi:negative modulator of initiation of replication [Escherichia coli]|nr:negative modulator of initiation of replication [Escherichia coli]
MVTHINLDDIVIVYQIASQYAKVVEAAKQTMDKNDGRIIVLVLCSFARGYSISWQSSFFRVVGLGYYVDHCATGLQQIRFIPSFSGKPGLTLSAAGIYSYTPGDLYSAKTLHWIKMKTIEVDDELYSYIASHTKHIGESASDILRRMLKFSAASQPAAPVTKEVRVASPAIVEAKPVKND